MPGIPFDDDRGVIPNRDGRVLGESGEPIAGLYCAGWIKRGPSGVIGTNKKDAAETVGERSSPTRDAGLLPRGDGDLEELLARARRRVRRLRRLGGDRRATSAPAARRTAGRGSSSPRWEELLERGASVAAGGRRLDSAPMSGRRSQAERALGRRDAQGDRELPGLRRADPGGRSRAGSAGSRPPRRASTPSSGCSTPDKAARIAAAGDRIASGELDDQFPIDVFQTGSGTSSNMNANEVIAALAGEDVHPNDDVNLGQSSNDVFPSAVHLAALGEIVGDLLPALDRLAGALQAKAEEFDDVVKSGRTHWMDAVPVTLGPGVRRLRRAGARGRGAGRGDARAARARSRSAAPPSAPG